MASRLVVRLLSAKLSHVILLSDSLLAYLSNCLTGCPVVSYWSGWVFGCLTVCYVVCLSVRLSVYLSGCLSIYQDVCLSTCQVVCLCARLSTWTSADHTHTHTHTQREIERVITSIRYYLQMSDKILSSERQHDNL